MSEQHTLTRRSFVTGITGVAGIAALPGRLFANSSQAPIPSAASVSGSTWREQGVIDLSRSKYAKLRTIPVRAVTLHQGFWNSRRDVNVAASIPTMHDLLEQHGRMDNFRRLVGQSQVPQRGKYYSDSDVYKWTEAASFAQQGSSSALFHEQIEAITKLIQRVQEPSGYLNTYYVDDRAKLRMTPETQAVGHELYNIGHLIQASVAQYRATGDARLLECCLRFVDGFLLPAYGPGADKKPIVSGHPEIEMALVELYRVSGDPRHLQFAGYVLEGDKRVSLTPDQITYMFCGVPFSSRTRLEGHAVRAMYACSGATDYYLETGDDRYLKTLNALWHDLVQDQMYVSGGVGARKKNEAFGDPYELPNASAYGESCAAIGNMMWNWRMLHAQPDARFTDVIERALYNGINSGMSLSGTQYCYRNPLAFTPGDGKPIRNPWYDTTCCPPNLERTFASLPGYFYSTSPDGIYVHLFHNSTLNWHLESGLPLRVEQHTAYPRDGRVELKIFPEQTARFTVYLRVPAWAKNARVQAGGASIANVRPGEYLRIERLWKSGDTVVMELPMAPQMVTADSHVAEDQGKIAVQRGPLLYAAEGLDQAHGARVSDLRVTLRKGQSEFEVVHRPDLLDGIDVVQHPGLVLSNDPETSSSALYPELGSAKSTATTVVFVPYYAWANREETDMAVWVPLQT